MMRILGMTAAAIGVVLFAAPGSAAPIIHSFVGTFAADDDVVVKNFVVPNLADVTFQSFSYAGGTNGAGTVIPRGGLDPILTVFGPAGLFIDENDDGTCG